MLAISAALAGPLLHMARGEGGGFHFFGQSSKGKTTIFQAAASVWGRGATPGYLRAWRATANGLEGGAALATDTALILDEMGVLDPREACNGNLCAGQRRRASNEPRRDGALREPKSLARCHRLVWRDSARSEIDRSQGPGSRRADTALARHSRRSRVRASACSIMRESEVTRARWQERSRAARQPHTEPPGRNLCGGSFAKASTATTCGRWSLISSIAKPAKGGRANRACGAKARLDRGGGRNGHSARRCALASGRGAQGGGLGVQGLARQSRRRGTGAKRGKPSHKCGSTLNSTATAVSIRSTTRKPNLPQTGPAGARARARRANG